MHPCDLVYETRDLGIHLTVDFFSCVGQIFMNVSRVQSSVAKTVCDLWPIIIKQKQSIAKKLNLLESIQKFPDWPPGARTVNDVALCH
jgi:hypothetical protein